MARSVIDTLLEKGPSEKTFRAICRALKAGNPSKAVLTRLDDLLTSWPDSIPRHAPDRWLRAIQQRKRCTALRLCRTIQLDGRSNIAPTISALAGSSYTSGIEAIYASHTDLGDSAAAALGSSKHLERLRSLHVSDAAIGNAGLRALVTGGLRLLVDLDISGNPISDDGFAVLASSPLFERLVSLGAGSLCGITSTSIDALTAERPTSLRELELSDWPLGARIEQLLRAPFAERLRSLGLWRVGLDPVATRAFARANLPALERLDVSHNPLGSEGMACLAASNLPALTKLELQFTELDDGALEHLISAPFVGQLQRLNLRGNHITDRGARMIASCSRLGALESLDIKHNVLTGSGTEVLARGSIPFKG